MVRPQLPLQHSIKGAAYGFSCFIDILIPMGGGQEADLIPGRGQVYASLAGETDAETGEPVAGYAVAQIDLDDVRRYREDFQTFQYREPASYRSIVRKY